MFWWIPLSFAAPTAPPPVDAGAPPRMAVLLDTSRSVGEAGLQAQQALLEALSHAHPDATWAVMAVDAAATWVVEPYGAEPAWTSPPLRHGSALGMGIAIARGIDPAPSHVIAVTDGLLPQSVPPVPIEGDGPPVHLVVLEPGAVTHRVDDHPLAAMAPGGTVHVTSRPAELAAWLVRPTSDVPVLPERAASTTSTAPPSTDAKRSIASAVDSVVDGCLKKPKHRSLLGPIRVETTRDEFVYLDLSAIDERYRWCLSGALFELDLPPALQEVPRARVQLDLRTP